MCSRINTDLQVKCFFFQVIDTSEFTLTVVDTEPIEQIEKKFNMDKKI